MDEWIKPSTPPYFSDKIPIFIEKKKELIKNSIELTRAKGDSAFKVQSRQ